MFHPSRQQRAHGRKKKRSTRLFTPNFFFSYGEGKFYILESGGAVSHPQSVRRYK